MDTENDTQATIYIPFIEIEYEDAWKIAVSQAAKLLPGDNYVLLKIELIAEF
jgi:hypothetical protein